MVKWWPIAGITLDLEIGFVKMRSSKTVFLLNIYIHKLLIIWYVFVKEIFKGNHLKILSSF